MAESLEDGDRCKPIFLPAGVDAEIDKKINENKLLMKKYEVITDDDYKLTMFRIVKQVQSSL